MPSGHFSSLLHSLFLDPNHFSTVEGTGTGASRWQCVTRHGEPPFVWGGLVFCGLGCVCGGFLSQKLHCDIVRAVVVLVG